ncbi:MAG: adenylate/guanylate cyclase domain-containing protein [Candidatus Riflebacteria bacterium]|nr:adenylate/guanylate cyclase domain-containing protein [Candidatus Riflebacteria bacterium]
MERHPTKTRKKSRLAPEKRGMIYSPRKSKFLSKYLSEMTEIVESSGGTVDKYIGNAVMAFWGPPIELKEHSLTACEASLKRLETLENWRKKWAGEGNP